MDHEGLIAEVRLTWETILKSATRLLKMNHGLVAQVLAATSAAVGAQPPGAKGGLVEFFTAGDFTEVSATLKGVRSDLHSATFLTDEKTGLPIAWGPLIPTSHLFPQSAWRAVLSEFLEVGTDFREGPKAIMVQEAARASGCRCGRSEIISTKSAIEEMPDPDNADKKMKKHVRRLKGRVAKLMKNPLLKRLNDRGLDNAVLYLPMTAMLEKRWSGMNVGMLSASVIPIIKDARGLEKSEVMTWLSNVDLVAAERLEEAVSGDGDMRDKDDDLC